RIERGSVASAVRAVAPNLAHSAYNRPICCEGFAQACPPGAEQSCDRTEQHPCDDSSPQYSDLSAREVFARVSQHVHVPVQLLVAEGQLTYAMRSAMLEARRRAIHDLAVARLETFAEVDVFEPYREELLVETEDRIPGAAKDRKASA